MLFVINYNLKSIILFYFLLYSTNNDSDFIIVFMVSYKIVVKISISNLLTLTLKQLFSFLQLDVELQAS